MTLKDSSRRSGRTVALVLVGITLAATVVVTVARRSYRGAHDTYDGLALRPPASALTPAERADAGVPSPRGQDTAPKAPSLP